MLFRSSHNDDTLRLFYVFVQVRRLVPQIVGTHDGGVARRVAAAQPALLDHGLFEGQWAWFIRTNQDGINFALYYALGEVPSRNDWQPLIAHSDSVMLEGMTLNARALCLSLREGGLPIIEIRPDGLAPYRVQLPDAAYSLYVQDSLEFDSKHIRLRYVWQWSQT